MVLTDFSSVTDGEVAVEWIKQFILSDVRNRNSFQEILVKKKRKKKTGFKIRTN